MNGAGVTVCVFVNNDGVIVIPEHVHVTNKQNAAVYYQSRFIYSLLD